MPIFETIPIFQRLPFFWLNVTTINFIASDVEKMAPFQGIFWGNQFKDQIIANFHGLLFFWLNVITNNFIASEIKKKETRAQQALQFSDNIAVLLPNYFHIFLGQLNMPFVKWQHSNF